MAIKPQFSRAQVVARALQKYRPASGVEQSQGDPFYNQPGVTEQMQLPADPGITLKGWLNPYKSTTYVQVLASTANAQIILPGNLRRTYLLIQNLGPGNIWVNFGSEAVVNQCHFFVTTQFYEQIGGGGFNYDTQRSIPISFVTRDYISAIPDAANTSVVITEGLWNYNPEEVALSRSRQLGE